MMRLPIKQNLGKTLVLIVGGCLVVAGMYFKPAATADEPKPALVSPAAVTEESVSASSTPEGPATAAPTATNEIKVHVVQDGDTLSTIASNYNIDVETIIGANPRINQLIHPGDELVILPRKGVLHEVDDGDTLWDIATTYEVEIDKIMSANAKTDPTLAIGDKLFIPGARPVRDMVTPVSRSSTARFVWPTSGELTSAFGHRWGRLHAGIDIANDVGTPIRAAAAGRVILAGWLGGYGYAVVLDHGQGYTTLYAHMSEYVVTTGQYVRRGATIGYMGNTGYSTGPHLHFEVRRSDQPFDPFQVLS